MRKLINFTLMTTVAIALLGLQTVAFGMAPVISNVPNPIIIGDVELSTPDANVFVFPDAFNLANFVGDESIESTNLIWTYSFASGSGRYLINGVDPLDTTVESPQAPPTDKIINMPTKLPLSAGGTDLSAYEWDPDGDGGTPTFRNQILSPLSATPTAGYPEPAATGILPAETQSVTLYCSDGSVLVPNYDTVSVDIKTDNGGNDRLGTQPRAAATLRYLDFVANGPGTGVDAWVSGDVVGATTFSVANGLSINVPALGDNFGIWTSPENYIQLAQNSVWRLRMSVTSDQTTAFQVPLWDVIIENFVGQIPDPALPGQFLTINGPFAYGMDFFFLDNALGANAAGTVGRTEFQVWFTPAPIQTAHFSSATNGAFLPALDNQNDMRVRFRVLDAGSAGVNANIDLGTVSLQNLEIQRFDLAKIVAPPVTVFNAPTITNGQFGATVPTDFTVSYIEGTVVDFAGGAVTLSPENVAGGWGGGSPTAAEVITVQPGDGFFNPITGGSVVDNFPITWESDTLYRTQVSMSAPNLSGSPIVSQNQPPDLISFINDVPQNELTCASYITAILNDPAAGGLSVSMARGNATTYQSFFYSHSASRTAIGQLNAFRPLIQIISANWVRPGLTTVNTGAIRIHSVNVTKVAFND